MNYIVMDLEWNQCPGGKNQVEKSMPFEIIQIGAIKLDDTFKEIDRFCEKVKPYVYPSLHFRTQEILPLKMEDLKYANSFPEVIEKFLKWCGPTAAFCTWGPADLLELQRNMHYYNIKNPFTLPLFYYDIQKIFSIVYDDRKSRRTLEHCIDVLSIPKKEEFHDALSDAFYTSCIMKYLAPADILHNFSIDYYQNPKTRRDEIFVDFNTYTKMVSREFNTKSDVIHDGKITAVKCYQCYKAAKKKIRWFASGSKKYNCLAQCEKHGWIKGKINIKKAESGKFFGIRILKPISCQEAQEIIDKYSLVQKKHKTL